MWVKVFWFSTSPIKVGGFLLINFFWFSSPFLTKSFRGFFYLQILLSATSYTYLPTCQSLCPRRKVIVMTWSFDLSYIGMIHNFRAISEVMNSAPCINAIILRSRPRSITSQYYQRSSSLYKRLWSRPGRLCGSGHENRVSQVIKKV